MSANQRQIGVRELLAMLAPLAGFVGVLVEFAQNPVQFVGRIISLYIIRSFFQAGGFVVNLVLALFDILVGAFDWIRVTLVGAFGAVGIDILGAIVWLQTALGNAVAQLGPAGPPVAVAFGAVVLYLVYRATVEILATLPVVGAIIEFARNL